MNAKTGFRLSIALSAVLLLIGLVFLALSIFTEPKDTLYLCIALASIFLANAINLVRMRAERRRRLNNMHGGDNDEE